jgi:CheY-like chemotaxis protein
LEDTGAEIIEAEDGGDAVKHIAESDDGYYDLVFMDTRMPVLDGYEATRRIRALDRTDARMMPIISMSANAFRDDIQAAYASGMNDYLIKPIDINRLAEILNKFLASPV